MFPGSYPVELLAVPELAWPFVILTEPLPAHENQVAAHPVPFGLFKCHAGQATSVDGRNPFKSAVNFRIKMEQKPGAARS